MKKQLIIGLVVLILIAGIFVFWSKNNSSTDSPVTPDPAVPSSANQTAEDAVKSAGASVPEINPVSKANPFSDIKTNPFK